MIKRIPAEKEMRQVTYLLMTPLSNRFDDVLKDVVLPLKIFKDLIILKGMTRV